MTNPKRTKYVVIVDRKSAKPAKDIAAELRALPGVQVVAESDSFLDLRADAHNSSVEDIEKLLQLHGADLHAVPEPELIDPIPPSKIPRD
ncbi:MAG: hypothetical protein AAGD43_03145 [Pseudomonadota bacterium]